MRNEPFVMTVTDVCRRWAREIADVRSRAARAARRPVAATGSEDLLNDALGICDGLLQDLAGAELQRERLVSIGIVHSANWDHLFDQIPVACAVTDAHSVIGRVNRAAALLLNVSVKHLESRLLMHFAEDREAFSRILEMLSFERTGLRASLTFRPRERAPFEADVMISARSPGDATAWMWFVVPRKPTHANGGPFEKPR